MRIRSYRNSATNLIGRILFPKVQRSIQRRDLRFLSLSILLGLVFCLAFGFALLVLNGQGRI
jgi:hypothetical protein